MYNVDYVCCNFYACYTCYVCFACYTFYVCKVCLLHLLPALACHTCYSCYAFFDCYTYSLSRCIIKSHEDLNQTWKIWFSTKQRSTYSLICFDQAPNNYRVFKFPWLSFYFFPALRLVCKRRREEKSEKLMVKTTLGTLTSLGYEN